MSLTVGELWAILADEDPEREVLVDIGWPPILSSTRKLEKRNAHSLHGVDRDTCVPLVLEL